MSSRASVTLTQTMAVVIKSHLQGSVIGTVLQINLFIVRARILIIVRARILIKQGSTVSALIKHGHIKCIQSSTISL